MVSDPLRLYDCSPMTNGAVASALIVAAKTACRMAAEKSKDCDDLEQHDCFIITELTAIEGLGFVPKDKRIYTYREDEEI